MLHREEFDKQRAYRERTEFYQAHQAEGFAVTDARQYYENGNPAQTKVETWMQTPYLYAGKPVQAYAVVDVSTEGRPSNTCEFWQDGRNLEDVCGSNKGDRNPLQLQDANGQNLDMQAAYDTIGKVASGASEYPHVFMYEEYVEARTPINKRMHLDAPDEDAYQSYLQSMERQLMSRDFQFVGKITKRSELADAYNSMPSVQELYDEPSEKQDDGMSL